jgi:hypothetical protein
MRTLLLFVLVAGCGDNSDNPADAAVGDLKPADASANKPDLKKAPSCDPVKQDCTDATKKCTLFTDDTTGQTPPARTCVADTGTNTDGQTCTRVTLGDDDCKKGFLCTLRGVPDGGLACRKMCHATSDCNPNEKCTGNVSDDVTDGICVPSCDAFSTTCGAGNTCGTLFADITSTMATPVYVLTCRTAGTAQVGDACTGNECGPDTLCLPDQAGGGTCAPLCNNTHSCGQPDPGDGGSSDDGGGTISCEPLIGSAGVCVDNGVP